MKLQIKLYSYRWRQINKKKMEALLKKVAQTKYINLCLNFNIFNFKQFTIKKCFGIPIKNHSYINIILT